MLLLNVAPKVTKIQMIERANVSTLLSSVFMKGDPKVSQRDKGANRCYVNFFSKDENSELDV